MPFLALACLAWLVPPPPNILAVRPRAAPRHAATADMVQLRKPLRDQPEASHPPQLAQFSVCQGLIEQARNTAVRGNTSGALNLALIALDSPPAHRHEHLVRGCNKLLALLGDRGELLG